MSSTSSSPPVPTTATRPPKHATTSISGNSGGADESDAAVDMPLPDVSMRSADTSSASAEAEEMVNQSAPIVVKRAQPSAAVTAMKQTKKAALEEAIQQEQQATRGRIEQIAHRFGKKKTSVQNRLFYAGVTKVQRKPNGWNTFQSFKVNEYNHNRPTNEHLSGSAYHKKFPGVASQEWHSLPLSVRREWGIKGMAAKAAKVAKLYQRRESNRSVMKDAYHTFEFLRLELIALAARTGMEMLLVGVRSEANQLQVPQHFATKKADDFLKKKVGMDVDTFASKLEIQVLAMDDDKPRNTKTSKLKNLRSEARELLHEGLTAAVTRAGRLPKSGSVSLNFPQYETKIVLPFGVELVGWPSDVPFVNPGSINRVDELDTVCRAIKSKQCVWEVLDIRQWNRRSKIIEDKVKKASKTTKTRRNKKAVSAEMIEESDGEEAPAANTPKTSKPLEKENIEEAGGANRGSTATNMVHTSGQQAHLSTRSNTAAPSPVTARSLTGSPSDAQTSSAPESMVLSGQGISAVAGASVTTFESLMGSSSWGQVMYGDNYMDWMSTAPGPGNDGAYFDVGLGFNNGLAFGLVEDGGADFDMMGSSASFGMKEWSLLDVGTGTQKDVGMGGSADQSMDD